MTLSKQEIDSLNPHLLEWVNSVASLTKPSSIYWCDGSEEEFNSLIKEMISKGSLIPLNQEKFPNCYLYRSDPNDVARTEESTFICTEKKEEAGPTNNWMPIDKAKSLLVSILRDSMKGRTMYVVPYLLGPYDSPYSMVGVQLTDSPYIVLNLKILTRMGRIALKKLGFSKDFVKGIHASCDLNPRYRFICHFPKEKLIISVNTSYGGNAILSKKCHALRIASYIAKEEGWLAEHMFVVGIQDPQGNLFHIAGAFPSASGKTNLAMLRPSGKYKDWKAYTLSDDIAWLHIKNGKLRAINPENGFFGVAPGTNYKTNPNIMETIRKNTLFTNVALTEDGLPWWEGLEEEGKIIFDWRGNIWNRKSPAAHPNARFTTPAKQYPNLSPFFESSEGVEISIIVFGGRRKKTIPLVYEAFDLVHGVLIGAMLRAETTAALAGKTGIIRNDPMAMLPFCGYNMAHYFKHFLDTMKKLEKPPKFFNVNWFRVNEEGKYIWPGYGENIRVIKWMIDRLKGEAEAVETPIGYVPSMDSIDIEGLNITKEDLRKLLSIDEKEWIEELNEIEKFFEMFGEDFPKELWEKFYEIKSRLSRK